MIRNEFSFKAVIVESGRVICDSDFIGWSPKKDEKFR
jgi:hypothetical protein